MHVIAAKAVAFKEADSEEFKIYQQNVVKNAKALAGGLMDAGLQLVSGGTDNHMVLLDLRDLNITGKDAETLLEDVGITVNKNSIPFDKQNPFVTSGIRLGTPALTTRGMMAKEMELIATLIAEIIMHPGDKLIAQNAKVSVHALCEAFPLYQNIDKGDVD